MHFHEFAYAFKDEHIYDSAENITLDYDLNVLLHLIIVLHPNTHFMD